MNYVNTLRQLLLGIGLGMLVACGGGGGTVAGIGGTGITASGTITGFGSIFVNGVEYETGGASIVVDDIPGGSESDLRLGMVVTVEGMLNADGITGTATTVSFDDEVQGPVETVPQDPTGDGTQLEFTVMGISVLVDSAATVFDDGVTFASLAQGDFIEVSGFFDQNAVLNATRIEGQGTSEVELRGMAVLFQPPQLNSFMLGGFTVNTVNADLSEVPNGTVTDGMLVEVKGTLNGNNSTTIDATHVEQEDNSLGTDLSRASVEGIVTDYIDDSDFLVDGQRVDASAAAFMPLSLVLDNGVEVEVEGPIVNGILQAQEVEARGGDVELEAAVQGVSVAAGTITLQYATGTVTVQVDSQTSLRDDLEIFDPYALGDIVATDFLEVRGYIDDNGDIIANEVRRDQASDDIVQGPADSCSGTSISLFGVIFDLVNGVTRFEDENNAQVYADAAAFCADVNNRGLFVKVQDNVTADGIADEAELED